MKTMNINPWSTPMLAAPARPPAPASNAPHATTTARRARGGARRAALVALISMALAVPGRRARAYDPATTHAGLTQRAALASSLHAALVHRLGRPLGLFEPIALHIDRIPVEQGRLLQSRLQALDPAGGYRPGDDGVASALGWLVAGSVIAWTPAERGQNSFLDPGRGAGLSQGGGFAELGQSLRVLLDGGGSLRGWATGTNFNLTGEPSTVWIQSDRNDVGLPGFYDQLELSVAGADRSQRNGALARALLSLGGVLAVLQDAGEPAHVRNDFRGAFLRSESAAGGGAGPFNRGSPFERYVADSFGIAGVPAADRPVSRPSVLAFLTAPDGQGLADRTQRRFFSDGTLPEDGVVDRGTTPQEVVRAARESLVYGLPGVPHLELRPIGRRQYVYGLDDERSGRMLLTSTLAGGKRAAAPPPTGASPRRLFAYERVPGRVRFFLDRGVYQDTARALLPEIGAYAAGLVDHLWRGEIAIKIDGGAARLSVTGARGAIRGGRLRLLAEDQTGNRREVGSWPGAALAAAGAAGISASVPAGTRVVAAVLRAEDDAGALVALGEQPVP
jgi:hypothetical protein